MMELIEALMLPLLITSGLIAILGFNTEHKWLGIALFVDFLIMVSYQEILLDPQDGMHFAEYKDMAPYYMYKFVIQALLTITYLYLNGRALALISAIIMANLLCSVALSLYGLDSLYYEHIMLTLSILQLMIGLKGAFDGIWCDSPNIHSRSDIRGNKGL